MKMRLIAAAVCAATLGIAGTAAAADVSIYGRTDAGLKYTNTEGGNDKLELLSGGRSTNRVGLNIVEDLGNGWKAKGYLETGFYIDRGAFDNEDGTLFQRRSILAIAGPYGELGMGRAGTVQSTMAPYTMGLIKYDPFGTSYGNASIGKAFANTGRLNNGIHYISPKFGGVNFGLSYSLGDEAEDGVEWHDKNHTLAMAVNYTAENLYLSATYANIEYKDDSLIKPDKVKAVDANLYGVGGWWRFIPTTRLFFGLQYQANFKSAASLSTTNLTQTYKEDKVTVDKAGLAKDITCGGFDGYSALLGMDWLSGAHKVMAGVQYFDGELAKDSDYDVQRTIVAGAYEYYFAKNVIGYLS